MIRIVWATSKLVYPEPTWNDCISRWKYRARALATPGLTANWFSFLQQPRLDALTHHHPYIFSKLQRPYLHRHLSLRQRLEMLKDHYEFLMQRFGSAEMEKLFNGSGWELAALPVPELQQFRLRLVYPLHSKEGELNLSLVNRETGALITVLAFSFMRLRLEGGWGVFIGGLQGNKSPHHKETVIHLTRSLHGLRPKALMVFVVQNLARLMGVSGIRAVSGREHIYRHYQKRRTFSANYDEFWQECQGQLRSDGNYELPLVASPRALEELPRNKRPVYRKRYQMLEHLAKDLEEGILFRAKSGIDGPVREAMSR